ncbi:protein mono-ADP-ribosyltransferase PARP10 [Boleophthalmus pectinirostris]|uniref:protein mono-ADP-ribosyltransferase PARP10 n=1 Tax=Boleophthalmus pectinirostris TaxID=150288 RepID=UPI000A1C23B5|nr:protein mono-ADP-ribosyltransferase PARP10 [Boleophthalmus pectinirostris]
MTEIQQGCVVEVLGLPQSVDDELLALYFENKRRSGGGPLVSVDKRGDSAILVFEEAEAAARVLSREHHVVHNAELSVRKPASKDPCRFLLKGINPSTSIEMIELFVENLMNLNVQDYSLLPSADKRLLLIQLNQPLAQDFQKLSERISKRHLSGAAVTLEHVTETDSVLVENIYPGTTADLISLYFESQRGGGQRVKEVLMLSEGSAKVTFVSFESVNRVLSQPHKLDNTELGVKPYFDFLQPNEATPSPPPQLPDPQPIGPIITNQVSVEQDDIPMQTTPTTTPVLANANSLPPPAVIPDLPIDTVEVMEESQTEEIQITTENIAITDLPKLALFQKSTLAQDIEKSYPNYKITITNNGLSLTGPKGTEMDQVKCKLTEFFSNITEVRFTVEQEKAQFLAQEDVKDKLAQMLSQSGALTLYTLSDCNVVVTSTSAGSARQASSILKSQLCSFSMQVDPQYESMLYCREWQEFCQALGCVKVSERGGNLDVLTLKGMEQEKQAAILTFLTTPIERETFIQMEPGRLKYIQIHSHQLLADMTEVSIFPVETEDISGLKIYGHPTACQIAEELLQGLVNEICTKTITVNAPGVTRFWQTDECKKMFNDMETKFQVCIFPEMVPWVPPQNQNMLECAWKIMSDKNFHFRETPNGLSQDAMQTDHTEANTSLINEAKKIVSVIEETPSEPIDVPDAFEDMDDVDLYSAEEPTDLQETLTPQAEHSENPLTPGASGFSPNLEEEAQLSLAIQYSMETSQWSMEDEDTQLQKALELSRQMSQEAQNIQQQPSIRTLQDTIESANTLNLVVFASYKSDLTRVDIAFNKKVSQRQDEQKLEHRCLKYISSFHKTCLDVIRRNHAVKIDIVGTIISVSGFKTYVDEAIPDVKLLLDKMSDTKSDKEILRTVQWVQHDPTTQQKTPYPPDLTVLLQNAWRMKLKTLDVLLDNQPHTINIEKMESHNIASGAVLKISRLPVIPDDNAETFVPEEDYSLLSNLPEATRVDEESDEFQMVVKNFYETIQQFHSKIRIVKVDKLMNKLLYSQYQLKKTSVKQSAVYPQVERTLYHGTSESSVKEICVHGFNRSFCGKNATVFGQGVYFAVNSSLSISDQYSPPNVDGHKFIFVAKVLTGDYTKGDHSMKTAPLKETGDIPLRYDSVTDDITRPSMFVIFNDTQAFPEYLITCQRIYGNL